MNSNAPVAMKNQGERMKINGRCAALGLVLSGFFFSSWTLAAVGRTPGSFTVSNSGAATYTIPIWAPSGPKGIQPNISLVYNSQAGNGYVGVCRISSDRTHPISCDGYHLIS